MKLLNKKLGSASGSNGDSPHLEGATVAFMDIQSANKALSVEHKFEDRVLRTNYYDPSASYERSGINSNQSSASSRLHLPEAIESPSNGDGPSGGGGPGPSGPSGLRNPDQSGPTPSGRSSASSHFNSSGVSKDSRRFNAGGQDEHRQQRTVRQPVGTSYRSQNYSSDG